MENNELTDVELFILLKGMIRQKETDKALKLADILYQRFEDLQSENENLRDEVDFAEEMYFESCFDDIDD